MPRAPHFMPLLLLLLLLSLPQTQAAFPQDPRPLLTSDLQGECPVLSPVCELSMQSRQLDTRLPVREGRCRQALSLKEVQSLTDKGEQAGGESWPLMSVASHPWGNFLPFEAASFGSKNMDSADQTTAGANPC